MHLPEPEHGVYLTLISPWGEIPEYPSKHNGDPWECCEIPALPGCPFKIAYAVSSYINWENPLFDSMPFYLSFQVLIGGQLVGEQFVINQRNKEECSGYLPGLYNGFGDGKAQWFKFCQQKGNVKSIFSEPQKVHVAIYRCSTKERKKNPKGTNMSKKYADTQVNRPHDSKPHLKTLGHHIFGGPGRSEDLEKRETIVLDPKFNLLGVCEWFYQNPSLSNTLTVPAVEHNLPAYSRGSKSSPVYAINPSRPRKWNSSRTCMIRFRARIEAGGFSPLRSFILPDAEEVLGEAISLRPIPKIVVKAQDPLGKDFDLGIDSRNPSWKIGISRTGRVEYSRKPAPNSSSRVITHSKRSRRPYMHVHMPPGWEKRYINHDSYFFDHNAGRTQYRDPRISTNTVAPVNPSSKALPLKTILGSFEGYLIRRGKYIMGIETSPIDDYRKRFQHILKVYAESNAKSHRTLETTLCTEDYSQKKLLTVGRPTVDASTARDSNKYLIARHRLVDETLGIMGRIKIWINNPLRRLQNTLKKLRGH